MADRPSASARRSARTPSRPAGRSARRRFIHGLLAGVALFGGAATANGAELPEYRLKAAFLYNFALFTEWPAEVGTPLNLCVVGQNPFGRDIDELQGRAVGSRSLAVQLKAAGEPLDSCQIVFITPSAMRELPRLLAALRGRPVLTIADSPDAARQGVALNMTLAQDKVSFEANVQAARGARLALSSKLLRLATEVHQ